MNFHLPLRLIDQFLLQLLCFFDLSLSSLSKDVDGFESLCYPPNLTFAMLDSFPHHCHFEPVHKRQHYPLYIVSLFFAVF